VTVPVLWDTKEETIVNNESREIIRMLSTGFGDVAERDVDLAPEAIREEVDEIITDIYEPINNGVYRAGFATKQGPYDEAVDELFDALDHWDSVLEDQRFLAGDQLTEADICMFTTLIRFDHVTIHTSCVTQYIHQYQYHKASSASCFCGLSSVSKRLYPTVPTRELRTDRRRSLSLSAAVSRRRDSVATHPLACSVGG